MEAQADSNTYEDIAPDGWTNPPNLKDLKQDLTDANGSHQEQVSKMESWLDNLHVRNTAKPKAKKNRSSAQPKLIRKQAEWRYPALTEPFLTSSDLFKVSPRTFEDGPVLRRPVCIDGRTFCLSSVLAGSTHTVILCDDLPDDGTKRPLPASRPVRWGG